MFGLILIGALVVLMAGGLFILAYRRNSKPVHKTNPQHQAAIDSFMAQVGKSRAPQPAQPVEERHILYYTLSAPEFVNPSLEKRQSYVFNVQATEVKDFDMEIFNRYGEVLYRTKNAKDGWDGKIQGTDAPGGVYYYRVCCKGRTSKGYTRIEKTGSFTLIRSLSEKEKRERQ